MGTNYYAVQATCPNPCAHCEQDEVHIGKSLRMFAAHDVSPWGRIESWQDWKRILSRSDVKIRDEYGHAHDSADFIADVESLPADVRRKQYDAVIAYYSERRVFSDDRDYLDPDGFSFYRGEFS